MFGSVVRDKLLGRDTEEASLRRRRHPIRLVCPAGSFPLPCRVRLATGVDLGEQHKESMPRAVHRCFRGYLTNLQGRVDRRRQLLVSER